MEYRKENRGGGDGTVSATSSVLNLCGHKDEYLCRALAEKVCRALKTVVVATGGFHLNGITPEQIQSCDGRLPNCFL